MDRTFTQNAPYSTSTFVVLMSSSLLAQLVKHITSIQINSV